MRRTWRTLHLARRRRHLATTTPPTPPPPPRPGHLSVRVNADGSLRASPEAGPAVTIERKGLLVPSSGHAATGRPLAAAPARPPSSPPDWSPGKSERTPLVEELRAQIEVRGPVSVATYMAECLSNPRHGYYMRREVFGRKGDFVTSPEISQVFGELVGVWMVAAWMGMGSPPAVRVVELGPGRGTLAADVLRAARRFPAFARAARLDLVEHSAALRRTQAETLDCRDFGEPASERFASETAAGVPVEWHWAAKDVPGDEPALFVAHEFFDALPVHQFQYTERGWCERMVDVDTSPDAPHHLRFVLSSGATPASAALLGRAAEAKIGDRVEVCPAGLAVAQDVARRVARTGGAALVVDYGEDRPMAQTMQGVREHAGADVLGEPGMVDLSALVDFASLRRVVEDVGGGVRAFPLLEQGHFLAAMGLEARVNRLLEGASEEQAALLVSAAERLVDPEQMGRLFKFFCFASDRCGDLPPFVEGADVADA